MDYNPVSTAESGGEDRGKIRDNHRSGDYAAVLNNSPPPQTIVSNLKTFLFYSGQFAIETYWATMMVFALSLMSKDLQAPDHICSALWLGAPIASFIVGTYAGSLVTNIGNTCGGQIRCRSITMFVSAFLTVITSLLFAATPLIFDPSDPSSQIKSWIAAFASFFASTFCVNFLMMPFFAMTNDYREQTVSKVALPIWGAASQLTVMTLVGQLSGKFEVEWQKFILFGIFGGFIMVFTLVSILSFSCCHPVTSESKSKARPTELIYDDSSKNDSCAKTCEKISNGPLISIWNYFQEGGGFMAFFIIFSWLALFSLMPIANEWFARSIRDAIPPELEYDEAIIEASSLRFWQQVFQVTGACISVIIIICLEKCTKKHDDDRTLSCMESRGDKLRVLTIIAFGFMAIFAAGLFMTGLAGPESEQLARWGFILTGSGPVIIYPVRELQRVFFDNMRRKPGSGLVYDSEYHPKIFNALNTDYDTMALNLYQVFGQFIAIGFSLGLGRFGYPLLIKIGAGAACCCLVCLIFIYYSVGSTTLDYTKTEVLCCYRRKVQYERVRAKPVDFYRALANTRKSIVFRPKKRHQA